MAVDFIFHGSLFVVTVPALMRCTLANRQQSIGHETVPQIHQYVLIAASLNQSSASRSSCRSPLTWANRCSSIVRLVDFVSIFSEECPVPPYFPAVRQRR